MSIHVKQYFPLCRAVGITLPPVFQELPAAEKPPETAETCGA